MKDYLVPVLFAGTILLSSFLRGLVSRRLRKLSEKEDHSRDTEEKTAEEIFTEAGLTGEFRHEEAPPEDSGKQTETAADLPEMLGREFRGLPEEEKLRILREADLLSEE